MAKRLSFTVTEDQAQEIRKRADSRGTTIAELIRLAVFPPPPLTSYQLFLALHPDAHDVVAHEILNRFRAKRGLNEIPSKTPDLDAHYRKVFPGEFEAAISRLSNEAA